MVQAYVVKVTLPGISQFICFNVNGAGENEKKARADAQRQVRSLLKAIHYSLDKAV